MEIKSNSGFKDMAHRIDMPEAFYEVRGGNGELVGGFIKHVDDVLTSVSRKNRVDSLSHVFFDLHTYKKAFEITNQDITDARGRKILERGGFDKRVIQTDTKSEVSKLVRDHYDAKTSHEGHVYTYSHIKLNQNNEFLGFLERKLKEESEELRDIKLKENKGVELSSNSVRLLRLNELADIYEVLDLILKLRDINLNEIDSRVHAWDTVNLITKNKGIVSQRLN